MTLLPSGRGQLTLLLAGQLSVSVMKQMMNVTYVEKNIY